MHNLQHYLRIKDAARFLGVSEGTLRNWGRQAKITTYRHPLNRYRLYKKADLAALLRQIEESGESSSAAPRVSIDRARIADFCRKHRVRKLAFFGSFLRDDFGPESDIDVLVEFEAGHTPGLAFFAMERELSGIMGRKVDLNTSGFLNPYFRDQVLREAEVQSTSV